MTTKKIINSLWFDDNAEEAAHFYASIFSGSRVGDLVTAPAEGFEIHGRPSGSTMLVEFELWSEPFIAINGGPMFKFNPSMSYYVVCETMEETNRVWESLLQGGSVMMPLQNTIGANDMGGFETDMGCPGRSRTERYRTLASA